MKLRVNLMSLFAKYSKEDSEGFTHLDHGRTIKALAEYLGLPALVKRKWDRCDIWSNVIECKHLHTQGRR